MTGVLVLSWIHAFALGLILRAPQGLASPRGSDLELKIFVVSVIIFILMTWYFVAHSPSGAQLAQDLGGWSLGEPKTDDEKKLRNVVEEMALASGAPIPEIYVLDQESGINAFAAGVDSRKMVVAVTRGAMEQLTRDELQAVIGHEFSHILHEDTALNMRLASVVTGFLFFMKLGEKLLPSRARHRRRSKTEVQAALIGFVVMVFGALGAFFGRLLQALISQQREYLADATSAQFTRHPESLARALGKILLGAGSQLSSLRRWEYSHIFFAEGLQSSWTAWLATHPPLRARIERLLPKQNQEDFLNQVNASLAQNESYQAHVDTRVEKWIAKTPSAGAIIASVGAPANQNFSISEQHLEQVSSVRNFLHNQKISRATLALVSFRTQSHYEAATELLKTEFVTEAVFQKIQDLMEGGDESLRVTLFHLALGSLRTLSMQEKLQLVQQMREVFQTDQKISLLEGLLLLNAEGILLPGKKAGRAKGRVKENAKILQAVFQMMHQPEQIIFPHLQEFADFFSGVSLVEKKKVVEELLHHFQASGGTQKEEFRLLCLAIKVPVPPF